MSESDYSEVEVSGGGRGSVSLLPGTMIGDGEYKVLTTLAQGGFGITYLCWDVALSRQVVLKENFPAGICYRDVGTGRIFPIKSEDQEGYEKSLVDTFKEAKTLASLSHPFIVPVFNAFASNGSIFIVMPYIQGGSLRDVILSEKGLDEVDLVTLTRKLLSGLEYLHGRKIYHRDIKPENVLINEHGDPVLIDFGAALNVLMLTSTHTQGGFTVAYAAPEQISGQGEIGPWTDIYSLGLTLRECVTKERLLPWMSEAGRSYLDLGEEDGVVSRLGLPFLVSLEKAISRRAEDRFQSGKEWLDFLSSSDDSALMVHSDLGKGAMRRQRKLSARDFSLIVYSVLGVLLLVFVFGLFLREKDEPMAAYEVPYDRFAEPTSTEIYLSEKVDLNVFIDKVKKADVGLLNDIEKLKEELTLLYGDLSIECDEVGSFTRGTQFERKLKKVFADESQKVDALWDKVIEDTRIWEAEFKKLSSTDYLFSLGGHFSDAEKAEIYLIKNKWEKNLMPIVRNEDRIWAVSTLRDFHKRAHDGVRDTLEFKMKNYEEQRRLKNEGEDQNVSLNAKNESRNLEEDESVMLPQKLVKSENIYDFTYRVKDGGKDSGKVMYDESFLKACTGFPLMDESRQRWVNHNLNQDFLFTWYLGGNDHLRSQDVRSLFEHSFIYVEKESDKTRTMVSAYLGMMALTGGYNQGDLYIGPMMAIFEEISRKYSFYRNGVSSKNEWAQVMKVFSLGLWNFWRKVSTGQGQAAGVEVKFDGYPKGICTLVLHKEGIKRTESSVFSVSAFENVEGEKPEKIELRFFYSIEIKWKNRVPYATTVSIDLSPSKDRLYKL